MQKSIFRVRRFRAWMRREGLTPWTLAELACVLTIVAAFGLTRII